jgi:long-chain acyl-CoA synthetase
MTHTIKDLWQKSALSYPDLTAIKYLDHKNICRVSYRELDEMISMIGRGLLVKDYSSSHIAIIGESSYMWVASYFGIVTGGNIAVPLDASLPEDEITDLINRADCEALFVSPKLVNIIKASSANCPKLRDIWYMSEYTPEGIADESFKVDSIYNLMSLGTLTSSLPSPSEDDLATIIFTSGTTGKSKGVMLTHKNLYDNVVNVDYTADPGAVVLSVLPIHHAYCLVMDWMKGFSLGACICINDSLMHMVRNMSIFNPDIMLMVPLMIESVYKKIAATINLSASTSTHSSINAALTTKIFGSNLKIIFTGGAHLDPYYIDRFNEFGIDIFEGYGMSECSPVITTNTLTDHKKGSIGKPLANVELSFEDGEILVRGTSVMKGYYKMEEETDKALKDGWMHTGDKGYLDDDGYLYINGRVKNLIILSNGENVSPEEIENKLSLNPLVREVIVSGENNGLTASIYPDEDVTKQKCLYKDSVQESLQAIIDNFNAAQPSYRHITKLIIRDDPFEKNATGKIKRFGNSQTGSSQKAV